MTAVCIDGKAVAAEIRAQVAFATGRWTAQHQRAPGLTVVLVGNDPASEVYVRNKVRQSQECGIFSQEVRLSASCSQTELLDVVAALNADEDVHGILVQLPLPKHIDSVAVIEAIRPDKDVDGFHPVNVGRLSSGAQNLVPCTPFGSMALIRRTISDLAGLHAVIVGRSNIVGKPMAQLLLAADCTVTLTHSKTKNLSSMVRDADIVVAAVGKPELVRGSWIKPGACVIDVGINRVLAPDGKARLIGDVAFDEAREVAGAITPVPGGVGPMTIACLLRNTLLAAERSVARPAENLHAA